MHTYHLCIRVGRLVHVDGIKIGDAKVLPVERLGEIIDVVDEEAAVVDGDCVSNAEVSGCEVGLDLLLAQLHDDVWECGGDVVAVLRHLVGKGHACSLAPSSTNLVHHKLGSVLFKFVM